VKILADTHTFLWWLAGDARLSKRAEEVMADSAHQRLVSLISLWEIAIKFRFERLSASGLTLPEIVFELQRQQFTLVPLHPEDLLRLDNLPAMHRDPFDRLLIVQALNQKATLLTADSLMVQYPVPTLW